MYQEACNMANIDPNIALGVKPLQVENPMNQYAMLSQLQTGQNQNALAQYQLSAAQRADQAQTIQNKLYAKHFNPQTGEVDQPALLAELSQDPNAAGLIPKLQAQFTEDKYKRNQANKIVTEVKKLDFDLANNIFAQSKEELKSINPNSPNAAAQYLAYRDRLYANPALTDFFKNTGMTKEATDAQVREAIKTPKGLADTILKSMTTADQFQKILIDRGQLAVSQGNLGIAASNLALSRDKFNREKTIGTIPSGYRLSADGKSFELVPGGPTAVALPPKELQRRETTFPDANLRVKAFETKSDSFVKDLEKLRDHPGLSEITGLIQGRLPALSSKGAAAQALYDKVVAKGGFQALQDLREASKTGGALGNVSNQEGKQLIASAAAIDRRQNAKDVQEAIDQFIGDIKGSKARVREAFDATYEYKLNAGTTPPVNNTAPVQIKTDEEYNSLPSGTSFIDPKGQLRRKP